LIHERAIRNVNDEIAPSSIWRKTVRLPDGVAGDIRFVYSARHGFHLDRAHTNIIPGVTAFDPFPFGLADDGRLAEAIFLSLFVLISPEPPNPARDKVRNDIEYDVNLRAGVESRFDEAARRLSTVDAGRNLPRSKTRLSEKVNKCIDNGAFFSKMTRHYSNQGEGK